MKRGAVQISLELKGGGIESCEVLNGRSQPIHFDVAMQHRGRSQFIRIDLSSARHGGKKKAPQS